MARTTNFEEVFGGAVAQQTFEIGRKIEHAAEVVNSNTAGAVAQQTIEIDRKIEHATEVINSNAAGMVAAGTRETVEQVKESEGNIISALFAKKEPWFIILSILSAIAIGFLLFWITGHDSFLTNVYDKDWNLVGKTRDVWSWFVVVLIPMAWAVFMIYVTSLGLKKEDR